MGVCAPRGALHREARHNQVVRTLQVQGTIATRGALYLEAPYRPATSVVKHSASTIIQLEPTHRLPALGQMRSL